MKILKLHNDWTMNDYRKKTNSYGGCGYYRTVKIAEQLSPEHEVDMWGREWQDERKKWDTDEHFYEHIFKTYDMVWLHYIDNPVMFSWLRVAATHYGKLLVMDIDDNFFEVHENNPSAKRYALKSKARTDLAAILSECDALTVSTVPLKQALYDHILEVHGKKMPIFVIPNYNDMADWSNPPYENKGDGVVIGYMGSVSHYEDFEMIKDQLHKVMEKYPNVVFNIMGQMTHDQAIKAFKKWKKSEKDRINLVNPTMSFADFPLWLSQQPWDIGIAPLIDSKFNESKSSIKWLEYSMCMIPTVASPIYPYYKDVFGLATIIDGVTGVLAKEDEWFEKLSMLIEDKALRRRIAENAYDYVADCWQYKDAKKHILKVVKEIGKL